MTKENKFTSISLLPKTKEKLQKRKFENKYKSYDKMLDDLLMIEAIKKEVKKPAMAAKKKKK